MGNKLGTNVNRMAIAAMSNVTHIEKTQILELQSKLKEISQKSGNSLMIHRVEFTECLSVLGINPNDAEILDKLFTMYDMTGDEQVVWKDFIVGISPLISGSHSEKIDFALRLYDTENTSLLRGIDIVNALSQVNRVASYFGDPVLSEEQISRIVSDVSNSFSKDPSTNLTDTKLHYPDLIQLISDHILVTAFINGEGTTLYGMVN